MIPERVSHMLQVGPSEITPPTKTKTKDKEGLESVGGTGFPAWTKEGIDSYGTLSEGTGFPTWTKDKEGLELCGTLNEGFGSLHGPEKCSTGDSDLGERTRPFRKVDGDKFRCECGSECEDHGCRKSVLLIKKEKST